MSPEHLPCVRALDRECFRAHPEFARRALAYRLLHLLIPPDIARLLPKKLSDPLVAPGVEVPLGAVFPPGTVLVPGCSFPVGWDPEDEPPECAKSAPLPTLAMQIAGGNPSTFLSPGESGVGQMPPAPPPAEPTILPVSADTSDGLISLQADGWVNVHGATEGADAIDDRRETSEAIVATFDGTVAYIVRGFLAFDLTGIPAGKTVQEATLSVAGYWTAKSDVALRQGDQEDTLVVGDFDAHLPTLFGRVDWQVTSDPPNDLNVFTLNQDGLDYLGTVLESTAKFCLLEYFYDHLGVEPGVGVNTVCGMYYRDHANSDYWPTLTITYV